MKHELIKIYRELSEGALSKQAALTRIKALKRAEVVTDSDCLFAASTWEPGEVASPIDSSQVHRHVLLLDLPRIEPQDLRALLPHSHCESVVSDGGERIAETYARVALSVFESIQQILKTQPRREVLVQLVIADRPVSRIFGGLSGLLQTVTLENPSVAGQVIFVPPEVSAATLGKLLRSEQTQGADKVVRYSDGARLRRRWQIMDQDVAGATHDSLFKERGVYLITGGLGRLGSLVAGEIQRCAEHACIVVTGRAALSAKHEQTLRRLQQHGRVEYRQLDITDEAQVRQTVSALIEEHGQLNGVIHSAGLVADGFVLKKTSAEFSRVLAPKVVGTFNLDLATQAVALDFFVLFSSLASCLGNVGQADYAAANGFMDEFAGYRTELAAAGKRTGRTLSVSWPHWQDGGMQIDTASLEAIRQRTGLESLQAAEGLRAFHQCLSSQHSHVLALKGDRAQIRQTLTADRLIEQTPVVTAQRVVSNIEVSSPNATVLVDKTRQFLREQLAIVLKVPAQKIDVRAPLEGYGIDSRMALSLTTQLEATFGVLAKTLFFEYLTVEELANYFVRAHSQTVAALFATPVAPANEVATLERATNKRHRFRAAATKGQTPAVAGAAMDSTPPRSVVDEPIAIVGLSGRYPEARNVDAFWDNLREGRDCIVEVPKARWDWREHYSADRTQPGRHYSKWGGFIEGVDEFDPRFFNISPREARAIDPQERLFLQHAWMALEDAGYTRASLQAPHGNHLPGQVGVYAGVMYGEYNLSGTLASIANRVSSVLNLHGPSLTLDTMCSSSLTAIHLACQDLKLGRTDVGIAGGVNVSVHPGKYQMLSAGQFIASDGHCQSFGEGGDGYIPGEGVGVVVLKRLSDAQRDGNPIYGVIRGSALNHGGKTNGYTVPNPQAQADVIRQALFAANVEPRHVSYIEAHGTGTKLGDPIEIAALTKAFDTTQTGFCRLGSAKSNIGHCESAAGIAGVTKVLLQMKHRSVAPSLHSSRLNPHIDFASTPFIVNQSLTPWVQPEIDGRRVPRIAGISSFGAGGANAHILIEEYVAPAVVARSSGPTTIVPFSARTPEALNERAADLLEFIERQDGELDLQSLAYTLQMGREAMAERAAFVVGSIEQLREKLRAFLSRDEASDDVHRGQAQQQEDISADEWIAARNLPKLANAWVQGLDLSWRELLDGTAPRMMSLPGYPFARERYWIEPSSIAAPAKATVLHPLVHANTSNVFQQRYSSTFQGTESFVATDAVTGAKTLPAQVLTDMIRAALELGVPSSSASGAWELHSTAWGEPVVLTGDKLVHIALLARDEAAIDVEIYSENGDEAVVHCQSQAIFSSEASSEHATQIDIAPATTLHDTSASLWSAATTLKKPLVKLLDPAAAVNSEVSRAIRKPVVELTDVSQPHVASSEVTLGNLLDLGDGIFCIDTSLAPSLPEKGHEVIEQLLRGLSLAKQQPALKALLVKGGDATFWRGDRTISNRAVELGLFRAVASFPYPVVAILPKDTTGAGLLFAAVCDFMVCVDTGRYGYTDVGQRIFPTTTEHRFFRERLGAATANDFLYQSLRVSGAELGAKGWGCRVAPSNQVDEQAHRLALDLAEKSQTALRLLKAHLARALAPLIDAFEIIDTYAWSSDDTLPATREITTSRDSLQVGTKADDVLVVRLSAVESARGLATLVTDLRAVLDQVSVSSRYRTVVLTNDAMDLPYQLRAADDTVAMTQLRDLVQGCPLPVIAAFNSNLDGWTWLLAQWCDACVYRSQSQYATRGLWAHGTLAREAAGLFVQRLGKSLGQEVCLTADGYSGAELHQRLGSLQVFDAADVVSQALHLAAFWRQWPRTIVTEWKRAQAAHLREVLAASATWSATDNHDAVQAPGASPKSLALRSTAVAATVHPEGVVVVTLQDRDARNMFTESLTSGLKEVFALVERAPEHKVVVLTGYDSYFATGGTRETLLAIQEGQVRFTDDKAFQLPMECSLPVIAAMQGHGIGAGWSFGMFSDVILYSAESRYLSPYMGYGFTPGAGATWVFPEKIGQDLARETLFTAKELSGRALVARGLPNAVLPRRELIAAAIELGKRIARQPREQLKRLKKQWVEPLRQARDAAYRIEVDMHQKTFVGQADTLARIEAKFAQDAAHETASEAQAPAVIADASASISAVAAKLRGILAAELHLRPEEIDDDTPFIDLGLDSITAVTWIRNINEYYRTNVEATKVYSFPTLREISAHVQQEAEKAGTLPKAAPVAVAEQARAPELRVSPPQPAAKRVPVPVQTVSKLVSWRVREARARRQVSQAEGVPAPIAPPVLVHSKPAVASPAIAVVGMAGQFPQARNIDEFWANIAAGRNCISEVSADRWNVHTFYQPGAPSAGKTNSKWLGALEEYDRFDPLFFNISPTEAESMDPQQRLFLQACWHSIENAGYNPHSLSGKQCGVFVGCAANDYLDLSREHRLSAQGFTGSSTSILAARIAYFLNLRGPCISIDTACSSSLVAIADACDSLVSGTSDVALAGGVYVMGGPSLHIMSSQAGMLSTDGRCFTFDERANGFVPGEAVGVLMLKRLEDAERDRDRILGVIQGWGVNQDGKTNGITAPNEESQTRLLQDVYRRFDIDPAGIQLIEAHGTGTKLGDPIEVAGLKGAFRSFTERSDYCALGSVKSNIGHCLTAAGAAGMIKLLQAIKHRQLPPTINYSTCNEHIRLTDSPFYVNDSLRPWEVAKHERRRAAISSFGFSGTNAHLVVAEYPTPARVKPQVAPGGAVIVPLSARTMAQLMQSASDLLAWLRASDRSVNLIDAAYTLQLGRDPMEERVAFVVSSLDGLIEKLEAYVAGTPGIGDVFEGNSKRNHDEMRFISQDEDTRTTLIEAWFGQKKLSQLASVWVKGLSLDWNRLYGGIEPRRIELPNYPFAKERCWISAATNGATFASARDVIHPLVHQNVSLLNQQRYRSEFSADQQMLAPLSLLEMVRAAVRHATGDPSDDATVELIDIAWKQPCVLTQSSTAILIDISAQDDDSIVFVVRYETDEEAVIVQGTARLHARTADMQFDIASLRRASHGELLTQIAVTEAPDSMHPDYVLPPSLMERALQVCNEFVGAPIDRSPVSIASLTATAACEQTMWARIRRAEDAPYALDVDLLTEDGRSCVQIRGLVIDKADDHEQLTLMTPRWDVVADFNSPVISQAAQSILVIGADASQGAVLQRHYADSPISFMTLTENDDATVIATKLAGVRFDKLIWIASAHEATTLTENNIIADQDRGIVQVLRVARALVASGYEKQAIEWDLITLRTLPVKPSSAANPTHAGLLGFAGSLSEAYPAWHIRMLDLEALSAEAAADLQRLPREDSGACFAHRGREWFGQKLLPVKAFPPSEAPYRFQGVYVAIGGAGGIGEIWTQHLVEQYQAKVIWIGRRAIDDDIRQKIARLSTLGPAPEYLQADASDEQQLAAAVDEIKRRHSQIHGVVHSAVGALDQSLKTVSEQDFRTILSVKIDLSVRIAQVFEHEPLDFVLFFSSNASFVRWGGMSGYSAGCTFKDTFARQLAKLRAGTVKVVNWGYWSVGAGAAFTDAMKTYFHETGHRPLGAQQAMQALDRFLASRLDQISIARMSPPATAQRVAHTEWLASYENRGANVAVYDLDSLRSLNLSPAFQGMTVRIGGEMEAPLVRLLGGILRATPEVIGAYERWLLESRKIAGADDAGTASSLEQLWSEWDEARQEWSRDAGKRALCDLVDKCLRALPDILTGKVKATDVMFPGSSLELVESVYKTGTISRAFNDSLCDSLVAAIEARLRVEPNAQIRLLEIGAGTGATTTRILDRLGPYASHIAEYCYTDISKTFLFHAENVYKPRAPYLCTQLFNVEQSIAEQGVAAGRYDFVIAANVIHATRNIRNTLRNAKAVLREQGMLLLNEISDRSICGHVTFGLLGGWWLNEDDAIRIPGSPGLYPQSWKQMLEDEGFHSILHPTRDVHALGLQIILAVSDGVVRQRGAVIDASVERAEPVAPRPAAVPVVQAPIVRRIERNASSTEALLRDRTLQFCRQLIGKALKLSAQQIDPSEPLESYGIDSLIVGLVNQQLQRHFENVSATLLYECQTVEAIAGQLLQTQRATLERLFELEISESTAEVAAPSPVSSKRRPLSVTGRLTARSVPTGRGRQPIAIVGISGLYPQAPTLDDFWKNLQAGKNSITEIPPERWSLDGFYEPDEGKAVEQGKSYCKWGGFIDQFAQFDTLFFGISPREALNMDPQERLFLQTAWSALENGGYTRAALREKLKRRVGVFAGVTRAGYNLYRPVFDAQEKFWPRTSFGSVANRLSYLLDVNGPSVPVDTMCSSSLTAIHEACEHIHNGDCDLAIAGGVNLYLHPTSFIDMSSQHMLSKDGVCRSFGQGANGFVPGEGVGVVVLKPLDRAVADRDIIHGVILATHVNHGGKTSGFTVPNPLAQAELVRAALDKAGIDARDVSYIEAHGTGTELGDPIEISGLQQAFAKDTGETGYCRIGSAKANIGHLEAAAGIAGLTKVLLQLKHGQIAPSLNASQLNPHIRFEQTPFQVNRELIPWERPVVNGKARPRIAGISSFGAGGANAHVILQEYVPATVTAAKRAPAKEVIVPLSARTAEQLLQKARDLLDSMSSPAVDLEAVAFTLQTGREAMDERVCFVVTSVEQLRDRLVAFIDGKEDLEGLHRGRIQRNDRISVLVQDDDIGEAIERWLARRKLAKVAQLWVHGLDVDWLKLYGEVEPGRVELPTYPFAKDRYWIDSVGVGGSVATQPKTASKPSPLRNLRLIEDAIDRIDSASLDSTQGVELLRSLV